MRNQRKGDKNYRCQNIEQKTPGEKIRCCTKGVGPPLYKKRQQVPGVDKNSQGKDIPSPENYCKEHDRRNKYKVYTNGIIHADPAVPHPVFNQGENNGQESYTCITDNQFICQ